MLKATFLLLQRRVTEQKLKFEIKKILCYFDDITNIAVRSIRWDEFKFNRNTAHYDMLLYFCRLVCEDAIANQDKGNKNFATLEDKLLHQLFERFVCAYCRKHSPHNVEYGKTLRWLPGNKLLLPQMRFDTFVESTTHKLIIETKFYEKPTISSREGATSKIHSSHLYQIFAYVRNEAAVHPSDKPVSGMLLYAQVDEPFNESYSMHGHDFYVRSIDLNTTFGDIENSLRDILLLIPH